MDDAEKALLIDELSKTLESDLLARISHDRINKNG